MNWDSSFENFKNYLKLERGLSINSIKSYEYDLNLFKNFIQSNKMSDTPFNCRPETVKNYLYNNLSNKNQEVKQGVSQLLKAILIILFLKDILKNHLFLILNLLN